MSATQEKPLLQHSECQEGFCCLLVFLGMSAHFYLGGVAIRIMANIFGEKNLATYTLPLGTSEFTFIQPPQSLRFLFSCGYLCMYVFIYFERQDLTTYDVVLASLDSM